MWLVEHLDHGASRMDTLDDVCRMSARPGLRVHRERAWIFEQEFLLKTCLSDWNRVTASLDVLHWNSSAIRAFFALLNHARHIEVR